MSNYDLLATASPITNSNPNTEFDVPWKEIIETYFADFIRFFWLKTYEEIDWTRPPEFLEQELNQLVREAEFGKRFVDKLVKVGLRDGTVEWIVIHIEVQNQDEKQFTQRMYVYHTRIYNQFGENVASLAILGDERKDWKPHRYEYEKLGTRVIFEFPVVKLLEYQQSWSELEGSRNPFAIVVMAHLQAQQTKDNRRERKKLKLALMRKLYQEGYSEPEIVNLFWFIDWVMSLPKDLEQEFWEEVKQIEGSVRMRYITSIERISREEGRQEGRQEGITEGLLTGIELGLKLKFGDEGLVVLPEIQQIKDVNLLRTILSDLETASTIEELRQIYQSAE